MGLSIYSPSITIFTFLPTPQNISPETGSCAGEASFEDIYQGVSGPFSISRPRITSLIIPRDWGVSKASPALVWIDLTLHRPYPGAIYR
jgi:hypothetical protein